MTDQAQGPLIDELKLKKKKKVAINEENIDELAEKLDDELSFGGKKKKKKPKTVDAEDELGTWEPDTLVKENVDASGFTYEMLQLVDSPTDTSKPFFKLILFGSLQRSYSETRIQEEQSGETNGSYVKRLRLLTRVFTQLGTLNPELVSDQKRRLVMVPPQMARVGTKKTLFVNFATICRFLNRDQSHLTTYILAELGTQGSVDANGALLIRGRYQSKHMEPVLRNYCRNYVLCGTCQSSETDLCKDSRLLFLHCRRCGSRITVKNVTSGFQAVTGRRAAIRAKTQ
ncbi:translation initiation factor 2 subunit 2 [Clonorchis sinensis]|uniref:Eukaryotic translation initiation factor 2 subunit 2 n=1 Tax=Clonorchis sinensis TaxID=79923 RepID=G7YGG7_CLOSI|nr:translation initiation factor 2 subunit 2 [Clonorchis sinensis]